MADRSFTVCHSEEPELGVEPRVPQHIKQLTDARSCGVTLVEIRNEL